MSNVLVFYLRIMGWSIKSTWHNWIKFSKRILLIFFTSQQKKFVTQYNNAVYYIYEGIFHKYVIFQVISSVLRSPFSIENAGHIFNM
jgi:hypothetical protein